MTVGNQTITAEVSPNLSVEIESAEPGSVPTAPEGLDFPADAMSITVNGAKAGSIVHILVTLESPVDTVRKLLDGVWDPFRFDGATGAKLSDDGMAIDLFVQDGGRGDSDGAANGVVVDPLAPSTAETLKITTWEVPLGQVGMPYSFQLEAAGAAGSVTWTSVYPMPPGLSLSPSGLITGIPEERFATPLIEATDGATVDRAFLMFYFWETTPGAPTVSAGNELPDGESLSFMNVPGGGPTQFVGGGWLTADGALAPFDMMSPSLLRTQIGFPVIVVGKYMVSQGGTVLDTETAEFVTPADALPVGTTYGSPDGSMAAVVSQVDSSVSFFDTSDWSLQRTVSGNPEYDANHAPIWSADSSRLAFYPVDPYDETTDTTAIPFVSAHDPLGDGVVNTAGNCTFIDWSINDRVLWTCDETVVTTAIDGSDSRVIAAKWWTSDPIKWHTFSGPKFSPAGTHVYMVEMVSTASSSSGPGSNNFRLVVAQDSPSAPMTPLTALSTDMPIISEAL